MTLAPTATGDGGGRRFVPPPRAAVAARRFEHPLFAGLQGFRDLLDATAWPSVAALDARLAVPGKRLVEQDAALLADGLHYETRIARGASPPAPTTGTTCSMRWCGLPTRS